MSYQKHLQNRPARSHALPAYQEGEGRAIPKIHGPWVGKVPSAAKGRLYILKKHRTVS